MSAFEVFNEQVVLLATVVAAVAATPPLIEFWVERRKRAERVALALEDQPVAPVALAGMDAFLEANADLVDAVRHPEAFRGATAGNELLILGGPLAGKKSVALWIAHAARMDRVITVHNPRDADVLAAAKRKIATARRQKVLLLLPNLDRLFERDDPELVSELDALVEHASGRDNVLVVATATHFAPDSEIDHLFGVKLVLPGTPLRDEGRTVPAPEGRGVLRAVTEHYLDAALGGGCVLAAELSREQVVERIVDAVGNPAEVEDILMLCRVRAVHGQRVGRSAAPEIDLRSVERAIDRVIVDATVLEPRSPPP